MSTEILNFLDTCSTNGNDLISIYNIIMLLVSVFLLSIRTEVAVRSVLILMYLGITAQYIVPVQFNLGMEYTDKQRKMLKYGMIVLSVISVIASFFISKFLFKDLGVPGSVVVTNALVFAIPGAVIPISELALSTNLKVNVGIEKK